MTNNENSHLFCGYTATEDAFSDRLARKKFLDAVFGEDAVLKIKVRSFFRLDLRGEVSTIKAYNYPPEYAGYLTNPHFYFFACIGNNEPVINERLLKGDYIGAIEQCVSSGKNLNLAEGAQTVAPFLAQVFAAGCGAIILTPDGVSCTPKEAYEWLTAQEAGAQEITQRRQKKQNAKTH
jgi:hypothetical protein